MLHLPRYAEAITAFITLQEYEQFNPEQVETALGVMEALDMFTLDFLQPFINLSQMETDNDPENPSSEWMKWGQNIMLGYGTEDLSKLEVIDHVLEFSDLGDAKPSVEQTGECGALVTTYSTPQVVECVQNIVVKPPNIV